MAQRRALLLPRDATNEGSRLLRELLRRKTFGAIARRLRCDERSVRSWAREEAKPGLVLRARAGELLEIADAAWDEPPSSDVYAAEDPATTKGRP